MRRLCQWFAPIVLALACAAGGHAADGNRLAYLDHPCDPYYVGRGFPKLTTPQWVGEPGVEAVVTLAIDDMRDTAKYEAFLRPILDRLKQIDGRAPVSIMTCNVDPADPQLAAWLKEGLSIEIHTVDHPCPLLQGGDFAKARSTYERCVDLMAKIEGNRPVAFRMPCCDSRNTPSPRFWTEIFNRTTPDGNFLQADSSVFNIITPHDRELPDGFAIDDDGRERFRKYLPFPSFVNTIEDYPYPYVIGRLCWEFPCVVPSDWEAQNLHQPNNPRTVDDMKAALDAAVLKQGTFNLVFHPHGWIRSEQVVELIDHAVEKHAGKVRFLTFREAIDRIQRNMLAGHALRNRDGGDNGVRLLDVNDDGYLDVVTGADIAPRDVDLDGDGEPDMVAETSVAIARVWSPGEGRWQDIDFPGFIIERVGDAMKQDRLGVRFGVLPMGNAEASGAAAGSSETNVAGTNESRSAIRTVAMLVRNGRLAFCSFADGRWHDEPQLGNGAPDVPDERLNGLVLRDLDNDGLCELIVGSVKGSAVCRWSATESSWIKLPFGLPDGMRLVDDSGRDAGLRFIDLDADGFDDVLFSDGERFAAHRFTSINAGWSETLAAGKRGEGSGASIPMIVRPDGSNNGAWVHSRHLWFQNEETNQLPDGVDRVEFERLLKRPPANAE